MQNTPAIASDGVPDAYDILNHTDLSRDRGLSGHIDLAHVNWGNYDLVVIDESHNFRNKRSPRGKDIPNPAAWDRFDASTRQGRDMRSAQRLLAAAVSSVVGTGEERAVASLFASGGTHALAGEFAGRDDFKVVAFLVVLPEESP